LLKVGGEIVGKSKDCTHDGNTTFTLIIYDWEAIQGNSVRLYNKVY